MDKVSSSSSSPSRKRANKPLMEKRRRARINQSLADLRNLILDYLKKESSRTSKLEKADILETTLRYVRDLQRRQTASTIAIDPNVQNKFQAGYNECVKEVRRYLRHTEGVDPSVTQNVLSHIADARNRLTSTESRDQSSGRSRGVDKVAANSEAEEQRLQVSFPAGCNKLAQICGIRVASGEMVLVLRDVVAGAQRSLPVDDTSLFKKGDERFNHDVDVYHAPVEYQNAVVVQHANVAENGFMWRPW